jgi:hypothetical protein
VPRVDGSADELPGVPKRRGRPPTGKAMTASERQAKYLARLAAEGKAAVTVVVSQEVQEALSRYVEFKDMTLGEAVDKILRDRLLRKR